MKYNKAFLVFILAITGCGGGDSGGDGAGGGAFGIEGIWEGSLRMVDNSCPFNVEPAVFTFRHYVNPFERRVVLEVEGGGTFNGLVHEDGEGFAVSGQATQSGGGGVACNTVPIIIYTDVNDNSASVALILSNECSDGFTCEITYRGSGVREDI